MNDGSLAQKRPAHGCAGGPSIRRWLTIEHRMHPVVDTLQHNSLLKNRLNLDISLFDLEPLCVKYFRDLATRWAKLVITDIHTYIHTYRQTDKWSTVTLAAHACQGLASMYIYIMLLRLSHSQHCQFHPHITQWQQGFGGCKKISIFCTTLLTSLVMLADRPTWIQKVSYRMSTLQCTV